MLKITLPAFVVMLTVPAAAHAADQWQVGTAPTFSSGKYGTDSRTEVLHTPISARRLFTNGDLTLVFPMTCIWGSTGITVVNGTPVRTERLQAAGTTTPTTTTRDTETTPSRTSTTTSTTRATTDTTAVAPTTARVTTSSCGMGDIVVRGRYYIVDEHAWLPTVALRAHVKTPTADAERGLGTGRPDEGLGIEISRTFARGSMLMLDGGYTVIGQPAGADYDNNWWYDVGFGQNLGSDAVNLSVFFSEYRAIVPGLTNARDVLVALSVKGASGWRIQISGEKGLSDGSPDHGITVGAARRF
jgi:outer membrane putative beta-barrel porin/alpha-amylase